MGSEDSGPNAETMETTTLLSVKKKQWEMNLTRHSFVETILNTTSALTLKCILCHYFVKTVLNDPPSPKGQWLCGTLLCKVFLKHTGESNPPDRLSWSYLWVSTEKPLWYLACRRTSCPSSIVSANIFKCQSLH